MVSGKFCKFPKVDSQYYYNDACIGQTVTRTIRDYKARQ